MKQSLLFLFLLIVTANAVSQRTQILFDKDWKFKRGDVVNAEQENNNDETWRTVQLPHDWSIEDLPQQPDSNIGPFSANSIGATATGYTIGGTAWYRKHFTTTNKGNQKTFIYFDGVYMNSDVWLNGHYLGNHPYGYTPFYYNITDFLNGNGSENTVAVRVRNEGRNSRWYSGSGIYRHVWLITVNETHIEPWGVFISTPIVTPDYAVVEQKIYVSESDKSQSVILKQSILDASGKIINSAGDTKVIADKNTTFFRLEHPHLWSPDSPYLYRTITELWQGGKLVDKFIVRFGVRSISINAKTGFLLNGKKTWLRGGCFHHDNGALGSAAIDGAEERKIKLLKAAGYNAVRTSHNPPSQSFLDACDKLGMLVIDEAFDQWERPKNPQDYSLYFDSCRQKDIDAMVLRDRNHPSVIFWSIGNEINERADSSGLRIAKELRDEIKRLDSTRFVTEAICTFWDRPGYKWDTSAAAFALLDVGGYNYQWKEYENDHKKFPNRVMMGTESFPAEAFENWQQVEKHPYVIGDFVWTAIDYLGETGISHTALDKDTQFAKPFPWFNAWCGDIDLIGGKKPQSYYRDVVWNRSKIEMLVHAPVAEGHTEVISYWGWPDEYSSYTFPSSEGKPLQVHVYTRHPVVRLVLNGKIVGEQQASIASKLTATFALPYQPGTLKAYGLEDGKVVDSVVLQTAGKPVRIHLSTDKKTMQANSSDVSYVTAELLDANGNVVPDSVAVHFSIEGNAIIKATASAAPNKMQSFQQPVKKMYRGKCLAIIQPNEKGGIITVKARVDGLPPGEITIKSERENEVTPSSVL